MLYIFDLDGTLVETYGTQPLPGVLEKLAALQAEGHTLAVATNQAGVAWRAWTRREKFPTATSLGQRFDVIAELLPPLRDVPWWVAIYDERVSLSPAEYAALIAEMEAANLTLSLSVSADPSWRKPEGGMLAAICEHTGADCAEAVFVGDREPDAEAAEAVGMDFVDAGDFFATSPESLGLSEKPQAC